MRDCVLRVARTANGYLIRIDGHATLRHSPAFSAFVTQSLAANPSLAIAVDLTTCQYLDSTFLGCLLTLQRRVLASPSAHYSIVVDASSRRLLSASRLDTVLRLTEDGPVPVTDFLALATTRPEPVEFGRHVAASHDALSELPGDHSRLFRDIADRICRELQDRPGCI